MPTYDPSITNMPKELRAAVNAVAVADQTMKRIDRRIAEVVMRRHADIEKAGFNPIELTAAVVEYDTARDALDVEYKAAQINLLKAAEELADVWRSLVVPF